MILRYEQIYIHIFFLLLWCSVFSCLLCYLCFYPLLHLNFTKWDNSNPNWTDLKFWMSRPGNIPQTLLITFILICEKGRVFSAITENWIPRGAERKTFTHLNSAAAFSFISQLMTLARRTLQLSLSHLSHFYYHSLLLYTYTATFQRENIYFSFHTN